MFVYEFCERGIQTVFPFYSLWSTSFGETVAYLFVGVATLSGVVYLVMFVVMVARAYRHLRDRQTNISHLSPQAQKTAQAVFSQWKCFLLLTATVAVTSISTVILPSEALVYQWQHHKNTYSIYTALVLGNYGLWNAYTLVTAFLHAPSPTVAKKQDSSADNETAEKMLTKQSVE
ncbi:Protein wntless [Geodia barretti]|nr:Protein wntless [Geodia barretti]